MYGDTEVIRKHVTRLREQGADIRTMADNMVGQVEGIAWNGRAADTMRERMRERASRLREAAGRHDAAADSLEKHLLEVDTTKESIATTQSKATAMITDAQGRIASIQAQTGLGSVGDVRRVPDPADEELAAFVPPDPGHKDWLAVDLPGLSAGS